MVYRKHLNRNGIRSMRTDEKKLTSLVSMLAWLLQCRNCWMFLQTVTVTNLISMYWPPVWDTRVNGVQLFKAETDRGCHAHAWRPVTLSPTAVGWGLRGPCKGWNPCGVRELQPPEQNLYLIHRLGFWVRLHAGGKKKRFLLKIKGPRCEWGVKQSRASPSVVWTSGDTHYKWRFQLPLPSTLRDWDGFLSIIEWTSWCSS